MPDTPAAREAQVAAAYTKILDVLLALKADGVSTGIIADAIVRAAHYAAIERIK